MSNGPQYFNEANKRIWEAVDEYFSKAGDDSNQNIYLARDYISKVGQAFTITVFPWVCERIEREGIETVKLAAYGSPGDLLDLRTFMVAERSVSQLRDVVSTWGHKAGAALLADICTSPDEDEQALAAYLLVDFVTTLEPIAVEMAKSLLQSYFDLVQGTSCKMAIAWALYNLGVMKPWEDLLYGDYYLKSEFVKLVEQTLKVIHPLLKSRELKELVCRSLATGDYPDLLMIPETQKRSVLRVLALDIASDGRLSECSEMDQKAKKQTLTAHLTSPPWWETYHPGGFFWQKLYNWPIWINTQPLGFRILLFRIF